MDDPVDGGETEADALVARREERLEDLRARALVHADAVVGDDQLDPAVVGVACLDRHPAARQACASRALTTRLTITCSTWPGIRLDDAERRLRTQDELDLVSEQPLQQARDVGEHGVQVERARLEHLAAAEGEQLLRQLGGAVGGSLDLGEVARELRVAVGSLEQQRRVAGDAGQEVVEVVCDAAGEPAEALELLGVQELRLQPLAVGHVAQERDVETGQEVGTSRGFRDPDRAVAALRLPLREHGTAGDVGGPVFLDGRELVRRQELVDAAADEVSSSRRRGIRTPRD